MPRFIQIYATLQLKVKCIEFENSNMRFSIILLSLLIILSSYIKFNGLRSHCWKDENVCLLHYDEGILFSHAIDSGRARDTIVTFPIIGKKRYRFQLLQTSVIAVPTKNNFYLLLASEDKIRKTYAIFLIDTLGHSYKYNLQELLSKKERKKINRSYFKKISKNADGKLIVHFYKGWKMNKIDSVSINFDKIFENRPIPTSEIFY